jgi:hypothetical protein
MFCGAGLVFAQVNMTASESGGQITLTFTPNNQPANAAITGRPYSATLTSERTTPDGTRMIQPAHRVYRDSQGRTRSEEQRDTVYPSGPFLAVEIVDPVAGYSYLVDSENRVAHYLPIKAASKSAARPKAMCTTGPFDGTTTLPGGIVAVTEQLGAQTIEGAIFCGTKWTATYPAGSMFHNDRPVKVVNEMWNAWDDGLPFFLTKNNFPGGKISVNWIRDVSLSEPDPALFRPPVEYAIVGETGTFAVQLPRALPAAPNFRQTTALTDMPFSAEQVYETRRTDPDGAVLTQTFSLFFYRDGMGRTAFGSMIADSSGRRTFRPSRIMDVVAGYSDDFDQHGMTVHRRPLQVSFKPASKTVKPAPQPASTNMNNGVVTPNEWLGTQTIEGFEAVGRRTIFRYPPGTLGGNDRLFVIADEEWNSAELGIALFIKRSHPEAGETVGAVRNVNLSEPDASVFRVPDGYRIVDDSESARK